VSAAGAIEARDLERRFGALRAVTPFRATIGPGGVTGLVGPNGSGKSTFLRLLLGIVPRDGGSARVDGVELAGDGRAVRARVTYAPAELALYGELSGRAHLAWLLRGRERAAVRRAVEIAGSFELPLAKAVRNYSHGMKRMLLVSAALAPDVRVRILDGPTEGLDPSRRRQVLDLSTAQARGGTTILLSSHHLSEVESTCDRMLFLRRGELLGEDEASLVRLRASRTLRIGFAEPFDAARLEARLAPHGEVRCHQRGATLFVREADPRPALREILADERAPRPTSIVFGELSLAELYRELYGAEGL
jgi:ABC-2 type transport system ATP-binding protein